MSILKKKFQNPTKTQMNMAEAFANACKKERRLIQTNELPVLCGQYVSVDIKTGKTNKTTLSRNGVNHHFGNMETFIEFSRTKFHKLFVDVIEEAVYVPKQLKLLESAVGKYNRFLVMTAVANAQPFKRAIDTAKAWAKMNKAKILIMPSDNNFEHIHEIFHDDPEMLVVFDEIKMNNSLFLSNLRVQANTTDPLAGKSEIAKRQSKSMVIASPKICQLDIPNRKGEAPLRLMATGAITKPDYDSLKYTSLAKNYKATEDHMCGGLIIEIENDFVFYNRHIEFEKGGAFIDLGMRYTPDGKRAKVENTIMVLGDLHSIEKDTEAFHHFVERVGPVCGVSEIGVQDFIDGESISHHDKDRIAKRTALAMEDRLNLAQEFQQGCADLNYLTKQKNIKKVFIVPSNHNEFVDRWLDNSRWVQDVNNGMIGSMIYPYCIASYLHRENSPQDAVAKIAKKLNMTVDMLKKKLPDLVSGKSPVQIGLEYYGVNNPEKVKWLNRDEHYNRYGIELGHHGDVGSNGAKFSAKTSGVHYGKCMVGHSHTAFISANSMVWVVGCLEHLNPEYARGASSWSHTSGLVYNNGARQLLTRINGKCFLDDKALRL